MTDLSLMSSAAILEEKRRRDERRAKEFPLTETESARTTEDDPHPQTHPQEFTAKNPYNAKHCRGCT